jgi:sugar O-acyltransferase (sialic acid O-acetyltransferase NeuD family)
MEIIVLGNAKNYVPVLFDIVEDVYGKSEFHIFHNLEAMDHPDLVNKEISYDYKLFSQSSKVSTVNQNVIFGINGPKAKEIVFEHFKESVKKGNYLKIIHPSAYVSKSTQIANSVIIEPNCTISSQSEIHFGVNIKRNCSIGHHVMIHEFCEINPGVTISSNVHIGKGTILGTGCIVRDSVRIGANSIIGMGSVVTKDIPDGVLAFGNPCKVIRENKR